MIFCTGILASDYIRMFFLVEYLGSWDPKVLMKDVLQIFQNKTQFAFQWHARRLLWSPECKTRSQMHSHGWRNPERMPFTLVYQYVPRSKNQPYLRLKKNILIWPYTKIYEITPKVPLTLGFKLTVFIIIHTECVYASFGEKSVYIGQESNINNKKYRNRFLPQNIF